MPIHSPAPHDTQPGHRFAWLPEIPRDFRRRTGGFALAIGIELLIIALLLTLGMGRSDEVPDTVPVTTFDVGTAPAEAEPAPEPSQAEPDPAPRPAQEESRSDTAPPEAPAPAPAITPLPYTLPPTRALPQPAPPSPPAPSPTPSASPRIGAVVRSDRSYGPADTGNARGADSERVGTAPDGSPLYAARWYREPARDQLSGYLSAASGPGWGLIACKTAPNWRVEDCVVVDEYPQNSGIARAVQAAAWQFQVRPPRLGGQYQVGSWVRIRIDYTRSLRLPDY